MSSRDQSVNITYGIMTMLYLTTVVVLNTLNIRLYEQEVLIPLQEVAKIVKAPVVAQVPAEEPVVADTVTDTTDAAAQQQQPFTNIENFGNVPEIKLETTSARTTKINKEAVAISESVLMAVTLPLAFGYIIGFDCSCPPNNAHVGKIIFCLGVFIPMIFIIVNEIISLLFPDMDILNPFLPPGSSDEDGKKHFFNKQYRKTFCWCIVTLTFIIHFFVVAFGQQSGGSSIDVI